MSASALLSTISGIHSKQPFMVLGSEQFHLHLAPENPEISHFYSFTADKSCKPARVIPDGCIDLLFDCDASDSTGMVYGSRMETDAVQFESNHRYFGVRFLPGVLPNFLTISASELIGQEYSLQEVMKGSEPLLEQVMNAKSFAEQVEAVNQNLINKSKPEPSQLIQQIIEKIRQHKGNIQVQDLERFSGYTTRTLQRLFKNEIGLTPKGFSRVIRCQSAVYDINHRDHLVFSELAGDLGFTDQSHFLREFKKLLNITPLEYQNQVKSKTYLERIYCH